MVCGGEKTNILLHGAYSVVGVTSLHKRKNPDTCIIIIPDERYERSGPGDMIECNRGSKVGESRQVARKSLYEEIRQDLKLGKNPFMQGRAILSCSKVGERALVFVQKASGVAWLVRG